MDDDFKEQSFLDKVGAGYEKAWQAFIMPTRINYSMESLGPPVIGMPSGRLLQRYDFFSLNIHGNRIEASLFEQPQQHQNPFKTCLIYLHSQSGCRIEGLFLREFCSDNDIGLCVFDFAGCGLSHGTYVSLGHYEKEDLFKVNETLTYRSSNICSRASAIRDLFSGEDRWEQ